MTVTMIATNNDGNCDVLSGYCNSDEDGVGDGNGINGNGNKDSSNDNGISNNENGDSNAVTAIMLQHGDSNNILLSFLQFVSAKSESSVS